MKKIYEKPESLRKNGNSFCPGCLHGVAAKLIGEVLDKLDKREEIVGILPIGCGTLNVGYFNFDMIVSPHGRAPAIATGYKRSQPDKLVFTYQGDGDLAAIGFSEIMHAANRGEKFTTIFINNGIYGMTGGQMAPTTLEGQRSTTSKKGRDVKDTGYPMKMSEMISSLEAPIYVARFSLDAPANILKAKKGIEKAFRIQMEGDGYTFIELITNCPTNWGVSPLESLKWIKERTLSYFPLGEYKNKGGSNE